MTPDTQTQQLVQQMREAATRLVEAKEAKEYSVCLPSSVWSHLMSCAAALEAANARADAAEAKVREIGNGPLALGLLAHQRGTGRP